MNLPRSFLLAALASFPSPSGHLLSVLPSQAEVHFLQTLYQKTDHGVATLDTKNLWIKYESSDDDIIVTVDVRRAGGREGDDARPKVILSLAYRLRCATDSFSHILPGRAAQGTTVCLETYGRDFSHHSYVFSY